uniref:Putative ovule protein n=1 Tax=Solanum chacoense TaxID=4108 RepID=A0A0V0GPX2_SOLCH
MAEISIARRVIKCIHLFDEFLDELSSFDLCITQKQTKFSGSIVAMENERRTKNHNGPIPPIVLIY